MLTISDDIALGGEGLEGDLLEIVAGATWAGFMIASSRALKNSADSGERMNFLFSVFACSALLLTPALFLYPVDASKNDVIWLLVLGALPTALAYYLWYEAAARVSAISASLMFTLSVIFTFINAYLFLGEDLSINALIGAVFIISSIVVTSIGGKSKKGQTIAGNVPASPKLNRPATNLHWHLLSQRFGSGQICNNCTRACQQRQRQNCPCHMLNMRQRCHHEGNADRKNSLDCLGYA